MPPFKRRSGTTGQYPGGRPNSPEQKGAPTRREEDTKGSRTSQRGNKRSCDTGKPERSISGWYQEQKSKVGRISLPKKITGNLGASHIEQSQGNSEGRKQYQLWKRHKETPPTGRYLIRDHLELKLTISIRLAILRRHWKVYLDTNCIHSEGYSVIIRRPATSTDISLLYKKNNMDKLNKVNKLTYGSGGFGATRFRRWFE